MSVTLLCTGLEILERGLVTFGLVFGGLESVFERGDGLLLLQEVLLELMGRRDLFELRRRREEEYSNLRSSAVLQRLRLASLPPLP